VISIERHVVAIRTDGSVWIWDRFLLDEDASEPVMIMPPDDLRRAVAVDDSGVCAFLRFRPKEGRMGKDSHALRSHSRWRASRHQSAASDRCAMIVRASAWA